MQETSSYASSSLSAFVIHEFSALLLSTSSFSCKISKFVFSVCKRCFIFADKNCKKEKCTFFCNLAIRASEYAHVNQSFLLNISIEGGNLRKPSCECVFVCVFLGSRYKGDDQTKSATDPLHLLLPRAVHYNRLIAKNLHRSTKEGR